MKQFSAYTWGLKLIRIFFDNICPRSLWKNKIVSKAQTQRAGHNETHKKNQPSFHFLVIIWHSNSIASSILSASRLIETKIFVYAKICVKGHLQFCTDVGFHHALRPWHVRFYDFINIQTHTHTEIIHFIMDSSPNKSYCMLILIFYDINLS